MDQGIGSILTQFDARLVALLGWVTLMAKLLVDWAKTMTTLPKWGPPAAAFGASLTLWMLLMAATGIGVSGQLTAQAILLALVATAFAIGSTALQARTNPATDTVTANTIVHDVAMQTPTADDVAELVVKRIREQMAGPVDDDAAEDIYQRGRQRATTRTPLREVGS